MSQFQFRLEKVRKVKKIQEEEARQLWAEKERILQSERGKLAELEKTRADTLTYGYSQLDVNLRQAMYQYLTVIDKKIKRQKSLVEQAREQAWEAKQIWLKKRQAREVLDKLREKKYQDYLKEEAIKEQKFLDELASRSTSQKEEA